MTNKQSLAILAAGLLLLAHGKAHAHDTGAEHHYSHHTRYNCETDMECESVYGFDMYGNDIDGNMVPEHDPWPPCEEYQPGTSGQDQEANDNG